MALDNSVFFTDSVGWCNTQAQANRKWSLSTAGQVGSPGRRPGTRYYTSINPGDYTRLNFPAPHQDFHVHIAFRINVWPGAYVDLITIYDVVGAANQIELQIGPSGKFRVTRNGTEIIAPGAVAVPHISEWHTVEILGHIDDSPNGWIAVNVDGFSYFDVTGLDTKNTANASAGRVNILAAVYTTYWHDILIRAGAGANKAVDLWGDLKVDYQPADAAGTYGTWTPYGAATRKECVDETIVNDETDYNSETAAGNRDSFSLAATPALAAIKGGMVQGMFRKDEVGGRQVKVFSREGATDYDGPATVLGDTYTVIYRPLPLQGGGGAWDKATWDAAEAGYKLEV